MSFEISLPHRHSFGLIMQSPHHWEERLCDKSKECLRGGLALWKVTHVTINNCLFTLTDFSDISFEYLWGICCMHASFNGSKASK